VSRARPLAETRLERLRALPVEPPVAALTAARLRELERVELVVSLVAEER